MIVFRHLNKNKTDWYRNKNTNFSHGLGVLPLLDIKCLVALIATIETTNHNVGLHFNLVFTVIY